MDVSPSACTRLYKNVFVHTHNYYYEAQAHSMEMYADTLQLLTGHTHTQRF